MKKPGSFVRSGFDCSSWRLKTRQAAAQTGMEIAVKAIERTQQMDELKPEIPSCNKT